MTDPTTRERALLQRLARLYDVQSSYADMAGHGIDASPESLLAILRALGAPIANASDLPEAVHARQRDRWQWRLDPVVVAWEGRPSTVELRLPLAELPDSIECCLQLEDGDQTRTVLRSADLPAKQRLVNGERLVALTLRLDEQLPWGYHELYVTAGQHEMTATVIAAPQRCFGMPAVKQWGLFLPLYSVHSQRSWGVGDLTDLGSLVDWASQQGAGFVGMLPLLASFLDKPYDPSPYSPVSRLFWNELFIDPSARLASGQASELQSDAIEQARQLNQADVVPYKEAMALKRSVLESQASQLDAVDRAAFDAFLHANPVVEDYAHFRAASESLGPNWRRWPDGPRVGLLQPGDFDQAVADYYAFAQWRISAQMEAVKQRSRQQDVDLYIDLPVGVHSNGYDAWRHQDVFVPGVAVGAPPDVVTTSGQNWGFQPLSPERLRQTGYEYVRGYLKHHLQVASILRIDHVMGLHRLYWIPAGAGAKDGAYVRYHADELYAILSLESHRHQARIVGENLGIVPGAVNTGMTRHNVGRMYVQTIEMDPDPTRPTRRVHHDSVASIGTHDLPTFAAFWSGADLHDRVRMGVLDAAREPIERADRERNKEALLMYLQQRGIVQDSEDVASIYRACLALLAESPAERVLIDLEDLWLETTPQNVPGTTETKNPNWRQRARYGLEELDGIAAVQEALDVVRQLRPASRARREVRHD